MLAAELLQFIEFKVTLIIINLRIPISIGIKTVLHWRPLRAIVGVVTCGRISWVTDNLCVSRVSIENYLILLVAYQRRVLKHEHRFTERLVVSVPFSETRVKVKIFHGKLGFLCSTSFLWSELVLDLNLFDPKHLLEQNIILGVVDDAQVDRLEHRVFL